jgi:hypothetical protein
LKNNRNWLNLCLANARRLAGSADAFSEGAFHEAF